ncbi:MAG: hypothetical protein J6Y04_04550 [Bacteroidaceae bacterium]|nr:hypothetical protein [Bacteroidaceae bacterium]
METLIRIIANKRSYQEQTELMEQIYDLGEFAGVALACMVVLSVCSYF